MSNGISARQNEDSNIARLAAQRQLYRNVSKAEIVYVILTVVIPISLSIIQDIAGWAKTVACIVSIIMLGFSFAIDNWQKEKKILAATIQQEFDVHVYSMEWDPKLFGKRKNIDAEIAKASKKIMKDEKEKEFLKDWYRKEVDSMSLVEGIAACQKENFSWDAVLRKRYRIFLIICLILVVGIQFYIGIAKDETITELLLRLVAVSSVLKWIIKTVVGINADLKRMMETLESSVCSSELKTMEELSFVQKYIFENRKVVTKIPDWFYKLFKKNDEDRERRALELK